MSRETLEAFWDSLAPENQQLYSYFIRCRTAQLLQVTAEVEANNYQNDNLQDLIDERCRQEFVNLSEEQRQNLQEQMDDDDAGDDDAPYVYNPTQDLSADAKLFEDFVTENFGEYLERVSQDDPVLMNDFDKRVKAAEDEACTRAMVRLKQVFDTLSESEKDTLRKRHSGNNNNTTHSNDEGSTINEKNEKAKVRGETDEERVQKCEPAKDANDKDVYAPEYG